MVLITRSRFLKNAGNILQTLSVKTPFSGILGFKTNYKYATVEQNTQVIYEFLSYLCHVAWIRQRNYLMQNPRSTTHSLCDLTK